MAFFFFLSALTYFFFRLTFAWFTLGDLSILLSLQDNSPNFPVYPSHILMQWNEMWLQPFENFMSIIWIIWWFSKYLLCKATCNQSPWRSPFSELLVILYFRNLFGHFPWKAIAIDTTVTPIHFLLMHWPLFFMLKFWKWDCDVCYLE